MRLAIVFGCTAIACVPQPVITSDAPADVVWVAAITIDSSGAFVRATPLTRWDPDRGLPIATSEEVLIYGWSEAALEAFNPGSNAPLVASADCSPNLPRPSWLVRFDGERLIAVERGPDVAVAAEVCPATTTFLFDTTCSVERCAASVTTSGACKFEIDATSCGARSWAASLRPDNTMCVLPSSCSAKSTAQDALISLDCGGCEVDVYDAAPRTISLDVDRTAILDVAPRSPSWLSNMRLELPARVLFDGYATDLEVLNDRVVIATNDGRFNESCDGIEGRWISIDRSTRQQIGTATTPACLSRLRALDSRLIAGAFDGGLGLFDADGRLLRRMPTLGAGRASEILFDGGEIIASFESGAVMRFDSATLEARSTVRTRFAINGLVAMPDRSLILIDSVERTLHRLEGGTITATIALPRRDDRGFGSLLGAQVSGDRLYVSAVFFPAVFVLDLEGTLIRTAVIWDRVIDPLAITPSGLIFGAARETNRVTATASWIDLETARIRPGNAELGFGVVTRVRSIAGETWALLPWSAELLKISEP